MDSSLPSVATSRHTSGDPVPAGMSWIAKLRASNFWPLLVKSGVVLAGMISLAAIGLFRGQSLATADANPRARAQLTQPNDTETTWLAPVRGSTPGASKPGVAPVDRTPDDSAERSAPPQAPNPTTERNPDSKEAQLSNESEDSSGVTPDGKIILNRASVEEFTLLPGIGTKRAQKIVALRKRLKRFRKTTDLLRVRGIGVKSLRKMLPHLVLDPPVAP